MRLSPVCISCGATLKGGLDTYGDVGEEFCESCWLAMEEAAEKYSECWYGMAPHHHDMTITGTFINSTVLHELPPPNEHGEIELADGLIFVPDKEVDGTAGMYFASAEAKRRYYSDGESD